MLVITRGFTLIEVMIVVVIISMLSMLAYPSYSAHIRKAERQTAQASLISFGQAMERARLRHPYSHYPNPSPGYPSPADQRANGSTLHLDDIHPVDSPADHSIKRWRIGLAKRSDASFRLYANALTRGNKEGCLIYESTGRRCHLPRVAECQKHDCSAAQSQPWN